MIKDYPPSSQTTRSAPTTMRGTDVQCEACPLKCIQDSPEWPYQSVAHIAIIADAYHPRQTGVRDVDRQSAECSPLSSTTSTNMSTLHPTARGFISR
jgi:hypothetical protein